jgi:flagellar motor protein MotB
MYAYKNKQIVVWVSVLTVSLLSGCTNYRQRYEYLNVEHENQKGRLSRTEAEKAELAQKVAQDQQTIEDLMRQLGEGKPVGVATGFEGMDVKWSGSEGTITVTLQDSILFSPGVVTLKSATIQQLDKVASVIKEKYAGRLIDVIGHTDSDPIRKSKWEDNLQLSTERANAVTRYLNKHGLSESNVRSIGRGASDPKVDNSTAAGKAKNRRVEIVVHMK